jgi:hypothetical protein
MVAFDHKKINDNSITFITWGLDIGRQSEKTISREFLFYTKLWNLIVRFNIWEVC